MGGGYGYVNDSDNNEWIEAHDREYYDNLEIEELWKMETLSSLLEKNKDIILGCLRQSDANFVYNVQDSLIESLELLLYDNEKDKSN